MIGGVDELFSIESRTSRQPVVLWSYGMGADSTAGLHRWLVDAASRPPELAEDLSNLIVLIAQTGDEWSSTIELVETYVLPVLRERLVRVVEVARAGPRQRDGIVVLQDSRAPTRLHADASRFGFFALSEEHRRNGIQPQLSGRRKCSLKAKGWPLDEWRARNIRGPYLHAIGFEVDEGSRIRTDVSARLGGHRTPIYPVHEWGWNRHDCLTYLFEVFGIEWEKSCCRECPYAGSKTGWPGQLARFRALPGEAAPHLVDEFVAVALNPASGLFGPGKTLTDRLKRDDAITVLDLAERQRDRVPWALYRVRRCFHKPATAWRSTIQELVGSKRQMLAALSALEDEIGVGSRTESGHRRVWLAERTPGHYPALEEFFVCAPAVVESKQRTGFETRWVGHSTECLVELELAAANALDGLRVA